MIVNRGRAPWGAVLVVLLLVGQSGLARGQATTPAPRPHAAPAQPQPFVFDQVAVVDVTTGRVTERQRVVVVGNRIRAVGDARTVKSPHGARVIPARGKYLIPGLWDMHNHPMCYPDVFYPLLIANGVTGIRDPGTPVPLDTLRQWRREIAAGARIGPRMVVSGGSLDDEVGRYPLRLWLCDGRSVGLQVDTPADGRHLVDSLAKAGADFIKVHHLTSRAVYFAIAAEARRLGIPFSGHLPDSVTAIEASDSGQRAIDHFNVGLNLRALCLDDSASVQTCAPVAARFRQNGTWFVPTMVQAVGYGGRRPTDSLMARFSARLREFLTYWPESMLEASPTGRMAMASLTMLDSIADSVAAAVRRSTEAPQPARLRVVHDVKLPVLAGTDAAAVFLEIGPGFSLHAELAILVAEGLTPLEALQAATLNPARFLHATDSLGTVASGKLADLVLLDADPLADITNTQKIRAVVANGRYFDRAALDELLAETRAKAKAQPGGH